MKYLLAVVLALVVGVVQASPYVRLSGGNSTWDSPTADLHSRDNQNLFDDRDRAAAIAIGKRVSDNFRVELEYTDFGNTSLAFNDEYETCLFKTFFCHDFNDEYMTDFEAYGVTGWVVYDVFRADVSENMPLSLNVRGGISRGSMKAMVNDASVNDSDAGVAYGLGLDLSVMENLTINASWEQHNFVFDNDFDYNPKVAKLGATWQF